MNKISLFNKIKTIGYRKILTISIIIFLIGFSLFNYHSTTYYSCKVELNDSKNDSDWYRVTVSVKKYLGGRYALNQYKLSQCGFIAAEDLFNRDNVYCSNFEEDEKKRESLEFDIVNGRINGLQDRAYGSFSSNPNISFDAQECKKINRSVD